MKLKKSKVIVIGIDGATFKVIAPLIKGGRLPNIDRMIENGVHGILNSTKPCVSPVAWTSFMTGKNPGKHDIFDFLVREPNSYKITMNNARNRKAKPLWSILSEKDRKVCVIGVTLTYPPDTVNGYMISGLGVPSNIESSTYTYPPSLAEEISKCVGKYRIFHPVKLDKINKSDKIKDKYLECVLKSIEYRVQLFKYLWSKDVFDFSMLFFLDTDGVSHHFWRYTDPNHKLYKKNKYDNSINMVYEKIDAAIGELFSIVGNDVIVVVSDHGFGPLNRILLLNNWLEEKGYLKFKKDSLLGKVVNKIKRRRGNYIDWKNTSAYFIGTTGNIKINLKGREPLGTVELSEYDSLRTKIALELKNIVDSETGNKIINHVYMKEELYKGNYLDNAPDILIDFKSGYDVLGEELGSNSSKDKSKIMVDCRRWSGTHEPEGIFIAYGRNFKKGYKVEGVNIIDIAPTLLYHLGIPIPKSMDGRFLKDIFVDEFLQLNPISYTEDDEIKSETKGYEGNDNEKVLKQLRDLGYID